MRQRDRDFYICNLLSLVIEIELSREYFTFFRNAITLTIVSPTGNWKFPFELKNRVAQIISFSAGDVFELSKFQKNKQMQAITREWNRIPNHLEIKPVRYITVGKFEDRIF